MPANAHAPRAPSRRGAILIIVTGLSALLLSLTLVFLSSMHGEAAQVGQVLRDTQARMMLNAAMCYVMETSRLGWGDQETVGWNDIRNHAVGPIPIDQNPTLGDPREPQHRVWTAGTWPAPGSTMRATMYAWTRPPAAVRSGPRNPVRVGQGLSLQDDPGNPNAVVIAGLHGDSGSYSSMSDIWRYGSFDNPDPTPVVDPAGAGFASGDAMPRSGSTSRAWFRLYREAADDHDGVGLPYYDVVNLNGGRGTDWFGTPDVAYPPNASVFLATCGAGATQGFRDWAEVVQAGATATFLGDSSYFEQLRSQEVILWYRFEWSPHTGDYAPKGRRMNERNPYAGVEIVHWITAMPSQGGSISWVQRLDLKPPIW
ncbi:MAG: hypothetical protein H0W72_02810 [Planctomycetes bacterium]|nr:hypothetical protein [Planctomycetota bacterium]